MTNTQPGRKDAQDRHMFYCRPQRPEERQQQLQAMIDSYLARGWVVTRKDPLTLYRGRAGYQLQNGVLVSL